MNVMKARNFLFQLLISCLCISVQVVAADDLLTESVDNQMEEAQSILPSMPRYGHDNFLPAKPEWPQPSEEVPVKTAASAPTAGQKEVSITLSGEAASEPEEVDNGTPAYRLQVGDTLLISIYGEANTDREVTVDSSGNITYPITGTMSVVGRTIDDVRHEMNSKIEDYYRFTFINMTPATFAGQSYTILGQVFSPGTKTLIGHETVLTAIARAGGFPSGLYRTQTVDFADLSHAFLARHGQRVPVDFERLVNEGDLSQDVALEPGDYIYIPSWLDNEIYVLGEVRLPGPQGFLDQATLVQAIALAGGITPNASSRAMIVRGSLSCPFTYYIDINKIFKGCAPDFLLRPGDIVYVPPRKFQMLRDLYQMAVSTFVSSFFSEAGSLAFTAITGDQPIDNVNVIAPFSPPTVFVAPSGP